MQVYHNLRCLRNKLLKRSSLSFSIFLCDYLFLYNLWLSFSFSGLLLYDIHRHVIRTHRDVYFHDINKIWIKTFQVLKDEYFCSTRLFKRKCCKRIPSTEKICDSPPSADAELVASVFKTPEMLKFTFIYFWCYKVSFCRNFNLIFRKYCTCNRLIQTHL